MNAKLTGEGVGRLAAFGSSPDFPHCIPSEFGIRVPLPRETPTLRRHVSRIISGRPQKQMIGANARRIVASMKDQNLTVNRAIVELKRDTMRLGVHRSFIEPKLSVPSGASTSLPLPARITVINSVDFGPEPFFGRDRSVFIPARSAAKPTIPLSDRVRPSAEQSSAVLTGPFNGGRARIHSHLRTSTPRCRAGGGCTPPGTSMSLNYITRAEA